MADQKALVTLKDGTKITVDDLSQLSQYSARQDLDSISFFGGDDTPQQAVQPMPRRFLRIANSCWLLTPLILRQTTYFPPCERGKRMGRVRVLRCGQRFAELTIRMVTFPD